MNGKTIARMLAFLPLALVAACNQEPQDPAKAAEAKMAAISRPDPRLPVGFPIYLGEDGAREFVVEDVPTGGKIATFSIHARPLAVRNFYEERAKAAGMTIAGRMDGGEIVSVEARKEGGNPRTFGATALQKGEFTNVTLMFDVTS
ncbi:hypothetical protein GV829_09590 [Sphingomonas lacunae]|uniref:Lipoprotein n=1 Tax=Sphingomonas lacunae TaxID=2698828 RepID=A0A6M4AWD3_9SPHN|nr:hypothetical protein [Sphingomonas lacunae]QJQ32670.1 hypothetical protein GV829_09590 [Sphingomonas lacunae]